MKTGLTLKTNKPRVLLPPLHPHQQQVYDDPRRFKVVVAGRRFGKSMLALLTCFDMAINHGKTVWFVSPTYNNVTTHWNNAKRMLGTLPTRRNEQQKYLEFDFGGPSIGSIAFKSGNRPDNLLGVGLDYVVVDEAAYQQEEIWVRILRPALSDRKGGALIIGSPNGMTNWFYRVYMMGQDPNEPDWASWVFKTIDNPYITPDEIEQARRDIPELKFKQEYLAEFVSDAGGVFRNLENACVLEPLKFPVPEDVYYAGVDWGRKNDFTVISVFNQRGEQVFMDRFTQIGWEIQRTHIISVWERWNIHQFVIEANTVGSVNIEQLQAEGLPIKSVVMTNHTKNILVERLVANLERGNVKLFSPNTRLGDIQMSEFQSYSLYRSADGIGVKYSAPTNWHDDTVIAAMLGASHIRPSSKRSFSVMENPFYRPTVAGSPPPIYEASELNTPLIDALVEDHRRAVGVIYDEAALRKKFADNIRKGVKYAPSSTLRPPV